MKKLILLLTICILTSCNWTTEEPLIVTSVEKANNDYFTTVNYKIKVNNEIDIFTNTYYNIGDTLK